MRRVVAAALALLSWSCAPTGDRPHQRLYTEDLYIQVWMDPVPPRALEPIRFRVVVRDKESGEPIEGGEGRIFATNEDRKSINNGFTKAPEIGTYTTELMFVTAGSWAVGLQFRRDSTQALQRVQDWMQQVYPERAPGEDTTKDRN
ncbi:MAG: hypothetical protein JNJ98_05880 [Gemmatimonadetes bacterium]|nr:hypothetical protein [Gemmatimonadota bacterium]